MPEQMTSNLNPNACPKEAPPSPEIAAKRHGILASRTLLQYEDAAGFHTLLASLMESWNPANAQEQLLVEQITQAAWRMQRITRVETGLFDTMLRNLCHEVGVKQNPHGDEGIAIMVQGDKLSLDVIRRYMAEAHREYNTLLKQLRELQKLRDSMTPKPPTDRLRAPRIHQKERVLTAGSTASANNLMTMPKPAASASVDTSNASVARKNANALICISEERQPNPLSRVPRLGRKAATSTRGKRSGQEFRLTG
jgi:hypothetical protein